MNDLVVRQGRLAGKRALVTGGSGGIGAAIVRAFVREGAAVVFTYRHSAGEARRLAGELREAGGDVRAFEADLGQTAGLGAVAARAFDELGGIDTLVNNAGVVRRTAFVDTSESEYQEVIAVNLTAPFFLTQAVARVWVENRTVGCVINIASVSAYTACSRLAHYQCAKAGLVMLTRGAAAELAPHRIRVNSICPGLTATGMNEEQWAGRPDVWDARVAGIPLGRAGVPDDHAGAAVFLASSEAAWVTGASLLIDGGTTIF